MQEYIQKVDSDYGFEAAKTLMSFKTIPEGFRLAGTPAENAAGEWIASEMKRIGLKDVTIESLPVDAWEFKGASVDVYSPEGSKRTMQAGSFTCLPGTSKEGIKGEVVYVGDGTKKNYEGVDVNGKIVLIDTDAYHTYWYNVLFNQAEARGAAAVIATVVGTGPGTYKDDLITTHDIMGTVMIPGVMLTKRDGDHLRKMLKSGNKVTVKINADITITPGAKAHYVYGKIPGRNPNRYVIVGGHYDAYWDGFLDNASSLGTTLTMAKAMIDCGYKPESTFIFLSNGAEEYGVADTCFGFCTGSTAILRQHPEWIEGTVIYNNYELTAINQTEKFEVICSPSCKKAMEKVLKEVKLPHGYFLMEIEGVGSDDAVFSKKGVPSYMNVCTHFADDGTGIGSEDPESVQNYDHTQYDNIDRYEPEVFDFNNKVHGLINMEFDKMPVLPLNFTSCADKFMQDIDMDVICGLYEGHERLNDTIKSFKENAVRVLAEAEKINMNFSDLKKRSAHDISEASYYDMAWRECKNLLKANKILQDNIYKYGPFSNIIIGHTQPYEYVNRISALIEELEDGEIGEAFKGVVGLDNNYMVFDFDKEVYEKVALDAFVSPPSQTWGAGETLPFPDMYDVLSAILEKSEKGIKDYSPEINVLKEIRAEQHKILTDTLNNELDTIEKVIRILEGLKLEAVASAIREVKEC